MEQFYLADTQIIIWSIIDPTKISPSVQTILSKNPILVSEISLLEITIKQKIGRLPELPLSVNNLATQLIKDGFRLLPIARKHIAAYEEIPLFDKHRVLLTGCCWQLHYLKMYQSSQQIKTSCFTHLLFV